MTIFDILKIVSEFEDVTLSVDARYNTGFLVEKYGPTAPYPDFDCLILKRDIPHSALTDEKSLREFLKQMDMDWEAMRVSVY